MPAGILVATGKCGKCSRPMALVRSDEEDRRWILRAIMHGKSVANFAESGAVFLLCSICSQSSETAPLFDFITKPESDAG